jgi:hypothetical protein
MRLINFDIKSQIAQLALAHSILEPIFGITQSTLRDSGVKRGFGDKNLLPHFHKTRMVSPTILKW